MCNANVGILIRYCQDLVHIQEFCIEKHCHQTNSRSMYVYESILLTTILQSIKLRMYPFVIISKTFLDVF